MENIPAGIVMEDENRTILLTNRLFCKIFSIPRSPEALVGSDCSRAAEEVKRLLADPEQFPARITEIVARRQTVVGEEIGFADGRIFERDYIPIFAEDKRFLGHMWQYRDITERKRYEEKLEYLSLHDQLTGLYNRAFFEEELNRLSGAREYPITMISADLDDLKLINDTMGHQKGDQMLQAAAEVLKQSLRSSDILARVGGDEFMGILPRTDKKVGEDIIERIKEHVACYNREHAGLSLGFSMGAATAENSDTPLTELIRQADDLMYQNKLQRSAGSRERLLGTVLAAHAETDKDDRGGALRMARMCRKLGVKAELSTRQLSNLILLCRVHDLVKVAIPHRILVEEGPLTEKEYEIVCQHHQKGYEIAKISPVLKETAALILKHHERWDGNGYPLGLKGEEIPIECRILAIVDAYCAMTSNRPHRRGVRKADAVAELKRCAGTQFDPALVEVFLSMLAEEM